jgi:class 3 adenylate cyclase
MVCPVCATDNPAVARFCLACGAPLADGAAPRDERRVVSIIFVDLVGFTARAEQLDPEEVRALLTPYHERVRRELESFGGVVEKFIGDAVMGVFGAPLAYGDDAERAVRAALVIRETVADEGLQIRIAVNTGEAVVSLGARPAFGEAMVAGDVVNTASRLQSQAPVNGIVVGEKTYLATRDVIAYEEAEAVVAKGKSEPVRAWIAVEALTAAGLRQPGERAIVGRYPELQLFSSIWARVVSEQRPHLVSVFGPAGVGKSTVVASFARTERTNGAQAVRGRERGLRRARDPGAATLRRLRERRAGRDRAEAARPHPAAPRRLPRRTGARRRASRGDRRHRRRRRRRRPRRALLVGPLVHRGDGARPAYHARLRGHALGRREPARPDRDAGDPVPCPAALARDPGPAGAARHT